jgi:UDP-N-acetylmuramate--alanine ligase
MHKLKREKQHVYFIGIGGAGVSALARYYLAQKWTVSGSDLAESPITLRLRKNGANVKIGHRKTNVPPDATLVIRSQAVRPENPELKESERRGIPTLSYPEAVGELTRQYKTIAVAGAHGKSTTTALAAFVSQNGGLDPTVIVGANLKEFGGGNFRQGKGNYLVLEADEFGRAFLSYSPAFAIVTNIDREHLDIYKDLADIKKTFLQFLGNVREGGGIILNQDNENIRSLKPKIAALARRNKLRVAWYSLKDPAAKKIRTIIAIPGTHNVSNALAAYRLGIMLGIPEKKILAAIHDYHGAGRRMEYRGEFKLSDGKKKIAVPVYDDYAHHPTEISATLQAFREKFPKAKIICVFQPHLAKRLDTLFKEFQTAFKDADVTLIFPLYAVAGRETVPLHDSEALVRVIQKREPKNLIFFMRDPKNLKSALKTLLSENTNLQKPAVIVMMGAGSIVQYTDALIH